MEAGNNKPWVIVYASDDNYAMQIGVSMISLFENNSHEMLVYVESDNISTENQEKLKGIGEKYGQRVIIHEMPDLNELAGESLRIGGWAKAAYTRLFLTQLIPEDYERILWIDADTCVVGDLSDLFTISFDGNAAMGVIDAASGFKRINGFAPKENYFNAGVLLINFRYWREKEVERLFMDEVYRRGGGSIDDDQSYINCVLRGRIGVLPPRYNFMQRFEWAVEDYEGYLGLADYRENEIYSREMFEKAYRNMAILHFAGCANARPWFTNGEYQTEVWDRYLAMSPWRSYQKVYKEMKPDTWVLRFKRWAVRCVCKVNFLRKLYVKHKYGFMQ